VLISQLLYAIERLFAFILSNFTFLFSGLEIFIGVSSDVAQSDFEFFSLLFGILDQVVAAFFGQRGNWQTDEIAVILRVQAEV